MSKKFLIVEDNDDMRLLYRRLFRRHTEIDLAEAESAEIALELVPLYKPDLMIIDISLPGMSGIELTGLIHKQFPDIKILIVTGHEVSRYREEALQQGADDLVSKDIGKDLVARCLSLLPR